MKKTKGLFYWGWNQKKTPQAKPGFACWGARWALYWQKSITTGYPAHSFACFSILQLSPNAPLDALWKPLTNATRNIKYFIDIEMYRNVTKSQHLKTDIKRQGSARRKASWLLVESLRWKECWWIRGCFHLCDHSANLPERIDELPVISALPLRKSHETTTEGLNFQEETIVHIYYHIHIIFKVLSEETFACTCQATRFQWFNTLVQLHSSRKLFTSLSRHTWSTLNRCVRVKGSRHRCGDHLLRQRLDLKPARSVHRVQWPLDHHRFLHYASPVRWHGALRYLHHLHITLGRGIKQRLSGWTTEVQGATLYLWGKSRRTNM